MSNQRTLSIVKPTAVQKKHVGEIITEFENNGLIIRFGERRRLTTEEVQLLYESHRATPYFFDMVTYMTSDNVFISMLTGPNAVNVNRRIMGVTDPAKAAPATLRARFGENILKNGLHGSISVEAAERELSICFPPYLLEQIGD